MTFPILDIEKSSVEKYLSNMVQDSNHRFKSWEYCYTAFGNLDSVDYLSLHLAFYLASWGMYIVVEYFGKIIRFIWMP
nr:MAG TPA: hypothetical protein [Caudoviricetes sp.]